MEFSTTQEIVAQARKSLGQGPWDYLVGGSESETTMRRNRLAFDRLAFRPRVLVDVSKIDTSATFLGQKLRIPVMLAPIGSLQVFHPEGGAASAKAAGEFGTIHVVSSVTQPALEETAKAGSGPKIFQIYVRGDDAWLSDLMSRAKGAGYMALCFTLDLAVDSRRERPMITGWTRPTRQVQWDPVYQASLTWEKMDRIKEKAGTTLILKGIATAEDAELAVEHGVDVIWVSNHGGRQLDHGLGSMEVLPEIVDAVQGRAKIVVDGAVQRGTDVVKALALGADVVAIGRMQAWGLAAAGSEGVFRVLEILEAEMVSAMGLLGVTSLDQLGPKYIRAAEAVSLPHEMSTWPNLPGERLV
ncbi:MAG: alpha-hydroxy-acid oxidizing protein [Dehalococcoidia bacterium]|nr:alpha-hydroxy-acid oxidizing protein [Dehalococcoidia bacterium]